MSVKIYNGYAYSTNDIGVAIAHFHSLRPLIADIGHTIIAKTCAKIATSRMDAAVMKGEGCKSPLSAARLEIIERQISVQTTQRRDPDVDLEVSVTLIPTDELILVMIWAEHDNMVEVLRKGLFPLPYWDNTDRPDNLSEEEWAKNGEIWMKALSHDRYHRPGNCGVTVSFLPHLSGPSDELIMKHIPTLKERVRSVLLPEVCESLVRKGVDVMEAAMRCGQDLVLSQPYWQMRGAEVERLLPEISRDILRYGYGGKG